MDFECRMSMLCGQEKMKLCSPGAMYIAFLNDS